MRLRKKSNYILILLLIYPYLSNDEKLAYKTLDAFIEWIISDEACGNDLTLQVMASLFKTPIIVISSNSNNKFEINRISIKTFSKQPQDLIDINKAIILTHDGNKYYDVIANRPNQKLNNDFCELITNNSNRCFIYSEKKKYNPGFYMHNQAGRQNSFNKNEVDQVKRLTM